MTELGCERRVHLTMDNIFDSKVQVETRDLLDKTETAMGTARVQKNFESRSIDINRQIMGARGISELCTVIERVWPSLIKW